jgi:hypothetical protein
MSITVQIQGEDGKREGEPWWHADSTTILVGDHPGTCCLRFLDPYGDAVFNQAQLPVLLDELRQLRGQLRDEAQALVVDDLCAFIERALDQTHTYVRFLGD